MLPEAALPLAYFITFTCYGTWLHGDKQISVDRVTNTPGTKFLTLNSKRLQLIKQSMVESPYYLNEQKRGIVLQAIKEVCKHRNWVLLAVHVRSNYIHAVIHGITTPELILNSLKSYAARRLNESKLGCQSNRWARHGSTRYLWKEAEVEATIHYVVHEQGAPMAVYENEDREFLSVF